MPYAYALVFLMYSCLFAGVAPIFKMHDPGNAVHRTALFRMLLFPLSVIIGLPVVMQIYVAFMMQTGRPLPLDRSNTWELVLSGGGCLIVAVVFCRDLVLLKKEASPGFFKIGRSALSVICAVFVLFTIVDHFMFFRGNPNGGVADVGYLKSTDSTLTDVECATGSVLVDDFTAKDVRYRCPLSLVWGALSSTPFAPWPSYTEGHSVQLGKSLRQLIESANRPVPGQGAENK